MTKAEAKRRIVGYLISVLESAGTCDDEKGDVSEADYDRLCEAEQELAKELRRRYRISDKS